MSSLESGVGPINRSITSNYRTFTGTNNTVYERPMDHLTRGEVTPAEAANLVLGCNVIAGIIQQEAPDIIFYPQRGAGPIGWVVNTILEEKGMRLPYSVDLPIGTHTKPDTGGASGIKGSQKISIVESALDSLYHQKVYKPGESKLMLVDEVQKGGTITQAAHALKKAQSKYKDAEPVIIAAVQDSRNRLIGDQRSPAYLELSGNQRQGFRVHVIPTKLFTVDRSMMLDVIAIDEEAADGRKLGIDDFRVIRNTEARQVFQALARALTQPERAAQELVMIGEEELAADIGRTALQFQLVDAMTDPRTVHRPTPDTRMVDWWERYLQKLQVGSRLPY